VHSVADTLLLSAGFSFASGIIYTIVGRVVQRRPVADRHFLANALFATWWYGLGLSTIIGGALSLMAFQGNTDLNLHFTISLLNVFLICLALLGLLYYLIYLFTGARNILPGLIVGYVLYFFLLVYYLIVSHPIGVNTTEWGASVEYENQDQGPFFYLIILLLIAPQFLGALALLVLTFRVEDREQRFRTAVVSLSIIIWFGSAFVAVAANLGENPAWQIVSRFIGLGAALAILTAYRPPAFLRRWLQKPTAPRKDDGATSEARAASEGSRSVGRSSPIGTAS